MERVLDVAVMIPNILCGICYVLDDFTLCLVASV